MIRLKPITTGQTFSIIPSTYLSEKLSSSILSLTENGTDLEEEDVPFTWSLSGNGNFIEVTMSPSLTLREGQIYTLSLNGVFDYKYRVLADGGTYEDNPLIDEEIAPIAEKNDDDVLFRDLIYITSQTSKREVFTLPNIYKTVPEDKTEYIVI